MKVLVIAEDLGLGGAEQMGIELANALAEKKINTYFAAAPGVLASRLKDVKLFEIPKYTLFSIGKIVNRLRRILVEIKPDIIHCINATSVILAGIAVRIAGLKIKIVLMRQSCRLTRVPIFLGAYLINKYCDAIIAADTERYNDMRRDGIKTKILVLQNFIDCDKIDRKMQSYNKDKLRDELGIDKKDFVVVMAGRLIPDKRFDKFISILAECSLKFDKRIVGLVVGDGSERQKLENLAGKYSSKAKILFLGFQEDVFKYFSISDLFLFPSEHEEVFPVSLVEACAAGLPVVCSNILGNRNIVENGYNGFLSNDDDYCKDILRIMQDKKLEARLSENAKELAKKRFDRKKIIKKIINLYKNLIKNYNEKDKRKLSFMQYKCKK